jgi:homoserine kinase type II
MPDSMMMESTDALARLDRVCRLWRLRVARVRPDLQPAGSPERSLERVVIEAEAGQLYLVERLDPRVAPHKMRVAAILDVLTRAGLDKAHAYLADSAGWHVLPLGGSYWQISPYLQSEPVPRPGWVWEAWRGQALADFYLDLRRVATGLALPPGEPYSIHDFVADLHQRLSRERPELASQVAPIVESLLERWLGPDVPLHTAFCHGDPHPLNVIWQGQEIRAVIDWEFCGTKPQAYDVALLIGCAGSEDPEALTGELVRAHLARLRAGGHPGADDPALWALVLGVRFGWLSEWLRRADEEMVALELDYMRLLVERQEVLRAAWTRV